MPIDFLVGLFLGITMGWFVRTVIAVMRKKKAPPQARKKKPDKETDWLNNPDWWKEE